MYVFLLRNYRNNTVQEWTVDLCPSAVKGYIDNFLKDRECGKAFGIRCRYDNFVEWVEDRQQFSLEAFKDNW